MKKVIVDCMGVQSTDEFWKRYVEATLPEGAGHFGRNLSAFWDAIEGGGPGEITLVLANASSLSHLSIRNNDSQFLPALRKIASRATAVKIEFA